ncbi:MAG: hypothetical protein RMK92_05535 [Armatimonadota bacterium]|nr:hypothetical protein [Armatimonadota bacterium]
MPAVSNPGSALGEAIGKLLEEELNRVIQPVAERWNCLYITAGFANERSKLILTDDYGNDYNVDAVITNRRLQPLVLIESKYIRYKKHNRDKASWICTAHAKLRERYATLRCSIAILMGSWSKPSKQLLSSFDVRLVEITFEDICAELRQHGIEFTWHEKDREKAQLAWERFNLLFPEQRRQIAKSLIGRIRTTLEQTVEAALDESTPRMLRSVTLLLHTNRGEKIIREFDTLKAALEYMQSFDEQTELDTTAAPSILRETLSAHRRRR